MDSTELFLLTPSQLLEDAFVRGFTDFAFSKSESGNCHINYIRLGDDGEYEIVKVPITDERNRSLRFSLFGAFNDRHRHLETTESAHIIRFWSVEVDSGGLRLVGNGIAWDLLLVWPKAGIDSRILVKIVDRKYCDDVYHNNSRCRSNISDFDIDGIVKILEDWPV